MYAVIDCNNFFVSCERIFRPDIEKKPVVVLSNNDGCIVSRSNEVKKLGVVMAAPAFEYKDLFRTYDVQVFSSNFSLYSDISSRVMKTIAAYAPSMELYSIDEVFVEFKGFTAEQIMNQSHLIKDAVQKNVGIPVSIGIGPTKTLAKIANEIAKKQEKYRGIYALPQDSDPILSTIPVGHVWGIGRKLSETLNNSNIFTTLQLKYCNDDWIKSTMSISVLRTVWELRGQKCVHFEAEHTPKKSIVSSRSFGRPVTTIREMKEAVAKYASRVGEKLREEQEVASYLTVYMLTSPFNKREKYYAASETVRLSQPTHFTPTLIRAAHDIVEKVYKDGYRYKKAAVLVTDLMDENTVQQNLFKDQHEVKRENALMEIIDSINREHGTDTVHFASQGYKPRWAASSMMRSLRYTTNWKELLTVR